MGGWGLYMEEVVSRRSKPMCVVVVFTAFHLLGVWGLVQTKEALGIVIFLCFAVMHTARHTLNIRIQLIRSTYVQPSTNVIIHQPKLVRIVPPRGLFTHAVTYLAK